MFFFSFWQIVEFAGFQFPIISVYVAFFLGNIASLLIKQHHYNHLAGSAARS